LYKRKGSRSIRIGFSHSGQVRVTLPYWVPYQSGIDFALRQAAWIQKHRPVEDSLLKTGDRIGKAHRMIFEQRPISRTTTSVAHNQVKVAFAPTTHQGDPTVQAAAIAAAQRALKKEADHLLPQRLNQLAAANGFSYKSVRVRQLKSRWGSCNSRKEIALSYYLMQLPWQLIDYVLLHELTHTEQLNHGADFWLRLEQTTPGAKGLRKLLKQYRPVVTATE
jgi:predicted metal-dependent hydrolase